MTMTMFRVAPVPSPSDPWLQLIIQADHIVCPTSHQYCPHLRSIHTQHHSSMQADQIVTSVNKINHSMDERNPMDSVRFFEDFDNT